MVMPEYLKITKWPAGRTTDPVAKYCYDNCLSWRYFTCRWMVNTSPAGYPRSAL